ncbi:hypothetical protein CAOG_04546 [Capsaspora owczarzaki ATCC 30864]|uniref:RRM domain-containing protein n=1 Tax=Capsaspora owczarzaki (strain ATCC 30864) TaxID=595528 RepID=A0A0D2WRF7_CAPO3|nr:hypothetical protein CAOG_04546 [Capsaspora owczarzaki ATCC 30864]KJE93803.1 hypothetical protein CAOG_004546 [Capsaspora owczarzaki ATCC 30864]|eukprot:XP_004347293.2 hypothetical protein CAOG_04546 [Capsaspora owczarzaki ATCC 30864]
MQEAQARPVARVATAATVAAPPALATSAASATTAAAAAVVVAAAAVQVAAAMTQDDETLPAAQPAQPDDLAVAVQQPSQHPASDASTADSALASTSARHDASSSSSSSSHAEEVQTETSLIAQRSASEQSVTASSPPRLPAGGNPPTPNRASSTTAPAAAEPSTRRIFVGGLSYSTTEETMRRYFDQFGTVVESTVIRRQLDAQPRGFGFVSFAEENVLDIILRDAPNMLDGRQVDPKIAVPPVISQRGDRPDPPARERRASSSAPQFPRLPVAVDHSESTQIPNNYPDNRAAGPGQGRHTGRTRSSHSEPASPIHGQPYRPCRIFVGGLDSQTNESSLHEYFSQFGVIDAVEVLREPGSGLSRRFGFVTFVNDSSVVAVLDASKIAIHKLDDKAVDVDRAFINRASQIQHASTRALMSWGVPHLQQVPPPGLRRSVSATPQLMPPVYAPYTQPTPYPQPEPLSPQQQRQMQLNQLLLFQQQQQQRQQQQHQHQHQHQQQHQQQQQQLYNPAAALPLGPVHHQQYINMLNYVPVDMRYLQGLLMQTASMTVPAFFGETATPQAVAAHEAQARLLQAAGQQHDAANVARANPSSSSSAAAPPLVEDSDATPR